MEKLAEFHLLLGLKFVRLEILSTSFIDFLYDELGELRSRSMHAFHWLIITQILVQEYLQRQSAYTSCFQPG